MDRISPTNDLALKETIIKSHRGCGLKSESSFLPAFCAGGMSKCIWLKSAGNAD